MADYIELHCHSCFSFREGASTPLELVLQARQLGYPALALTYHDGLAGAMEFAQSAKEWGVAPIIGAEVTLRPSPRPSAPLPPAGEGPGERAHHLTLLAATPRGYANLSRLLSMAHLSSPRGEPSLDPAALVDRTEGLIALSGCRQGEVSQLIEAYDVEGARRAAARYAELFDRESFFIELQDNLVYGDRRRNRGLVELARDLSLDVVATNNVHYHVRERHRLQDVLVAVRHRTTLDASERVRRKNAECYLKSPEEMAALFAELPEALRNTVAIAERCVPPRADANCHSERSEACPRAQRRESGPCNANSTFQEQDGTFLEPTHPPRNVVVKSGGHPQTPGSGGSPPLHFSDQRVPFPGSSGQGFDLTRDLTYVFPDYESPDGKTADELLEEVCFAAARELYS
jgi:error-prone DNA polymerase